MPTQQQETGQQTLDAAFDALEQELPARISRFLQWLRRPQARWFRVPIGLLLLAGSFLWFLPILGIEMLPLGLLLIAQDLPFLRRPVGRAILWMVACWKRLKAWHQQRTQA